MKKYKILLISTLSFFAFFCESAYMMSNFAFIYFPEELEDFYNERSDLKAFAPTYFGGVKYTDLDKYCGALNPKFSDEALFKKDPEIQANTNRCYILAKFQNGNKIKTFLFAPHSNKMIHEYDEYSIPNAECKDELPIFAPDYHGNIKWRPYEEKPSSAFADFFEAMNEYSHFMSDLYFRGKRYSFTPELGRLVGCSLTRNGEVMLESSDGVATGEGGTFMYEEKEKRLRIYYSASRKILRFESNFPQPVKKTLKLRYLEPDDNMKSFFETLKTFWNERQNDLKGFNLTYAGLEMGETLNEYYGNLSPKFYFREKEHFDRRNWGVKVYILVKFQKQDRLKAFIFLPETFELLHEFNEHKIHIDIFEAQNSISSLKNKISTKFKKNTSGNKANTLPIHSPNYLPKQTAYEKNPQFIFEKFTEAIDAYEICLNKSYENYITYLHPEDSTNTICLTNTGEIRMECDTWINSMRSNYYMMGFGGGTLYGIFNPKNKTFRFESYLERGNWLNEEKFKYDGHWIPISQNKDKN